MSACSFQTVLIFLGHHKPDFSGVMLVTVSPENVTSAGSISWSFFNQVSSTDSEKPDAFQPLYCMTADAEGFVLRSWPPPPPSWTPVCCLSSRPLAASLPPCTHQIPSQNTKVSLLHIPSHQRRIMACTSLAWPKLVLEFHQGDRIGLQANSDELLR